MEKKFNVKEILNKILKFLNNTKNLILNNKIYLGACILSIIILIIGSITVGFLRSFLFILLVDTVFILNEIQNSKKRNQNKNDDLIEKLLKPDKKMINQDNEVEIDNDEDNSDDVINNKEDNRSNEVMASNKKVVKKANNSKNTKIEKKNTKGKKGKKGKAKKIIKIILIVCFALGIIGLIAICIFFKMIIDEAPDFDVNNLVMSEASIIIDSDGNEWNKLGSQKRELISYDEIPEILIDAIVATEDSRFFQHNGFDLPRFLKASLGQVSGNSDAGGASTLTMQIIKNAYTVKNENTAEKSSGMTGIKRKFTDIYMAIFKLEKNYSKQEILEFYVNYSYLGSNSYGVEQACLTYFNKSAKDINISEAALIAGLYQSPGSYDPLKSEESAKRAEQRRLTVLKLMERHGYITSEEREIAEKLTVDKIVVGTRSGNVSEFQSFEDMVLNELSEKTDLDPNTTPLAVYTTMDRNKQTNINKIMSGEKFWWENDKVQAGIAVIDVKTGAIVAIGSGRNVTGAKTFNFATFKSFDDIHLRQIGSTAKPLYDYAPAIEYNNASTYGPVTDEMYTYTGGGEMNNWDNGFGGFMTYRTALTVSRNIPALKTFQSVSNSQIYEMATNLGLHPELEGGYVHEAHSIGAYNGESPVSLAGAYAAFANNGYYNEPYSIVKVVRRDTGEVVYEHKDSSRKAMGSDTAYMVTNMLQNTAGWALGQYYNVNGIKYAAKTGTTNFDKKHMEAQGIPANAINDLWVAGFDSNYSIAVWYGYEQMTRENVENGYYTIMGNSNHSSLFQVVAEGVFTNADFEQPANVISVTVEWETSPALLPSEFTPNDMKTTELFKAGTEPAETSKRYARLSNVTNLKATVNEDKVTLSWTGIKTPDAIDETYLKNYFNRIYTNPEFQASKLQERLDGNKNSIGTIGYNIYIKESDGNLKLIDFTKDTTFVHTIKTATAKDVTYVVKTSYSIFKDNMSTGVETKVSVKANTTEITAQLTTDRNISLKIGDKYTEPATPVKVLENGTDVTSKATITTSIVRKSDNTKVATVKDITTTKEETYEITYTATYNKETFTLIKTITVATA